MTGDDCECRGGGRGLKKLSPRNIALLAHGVTAFFNGTEGMFNSSDWRPQIQEEDFRADCPGCGGALLMNRSQMLSLRARVSGRSALFASRRRQGQSTPGLE
jgi:hypothetical protein